MSAPDRRRVLLGTLAALATAPFAQAANARRVVTIGGAITEIVHALGAGGWIVGTDSTSTFPEEVNRLPRVGYMRQLSAEGVLSLRPDLVLATAEAGPPAALAQLEAAGVIVRRLPVRHSIAALRANVAAVADGLGMADGARRLIDALDSKWSSCHARVAALEDTPRTMFLLAHGGGAPLVSGRNTAADAMIAYAGAVNAVQAFDGYKPLTAEAAIAAAPQVILVTTQGLENTGGATGLLGRPGLAVTPAGRGRHLVAMDALLLLGFGPRLPDAVDELAGRLRRA